MAYKFGIIKERFDIQVTSANSVIKGEFELDKNAHKVIGFNVTADRDDLIYYRGSQKIQLNDSELFPEDFETKLLMAGLNVSPNDRVIKIGNVDSGNGRLEVWYKDTDLAPTIFVPYRISFYVYSYSDDFDYQNEEV